MQCIKPIRLINQNADGSYRYDYVPCGKCVNCLFNKRNEWFARLMLEGQNSVLPPVFITLTYDDYYLPPDGNVSKTDVQKFFKRLRYHLPEDHFRYFVVSEYGPTRHRPHYHAIMFDFPTDKATIDFIGKVWMLGFVSVGIAHDGGLSYCCKYVGFKSLDYGKAPNFMLSSRRPAIGASYLEVVDNVEFHQRDPINNSYVTINGKKFTLPRYLREKIYDEKSKTIRREKFSEDAQKRAIEYRIKATRGRPSDRREFKSHSEAIAERERRYRESLKRQKDV